MVYESFTPLTKISLVSHSIGWLLKIKVYTADCLERPMRERMYYEVSTSEWIATMFLECVQETSFLMLALSVCCVFF